MEHRAARASRVIDEVKLAARGGGFPMGVSFLETENPGRGLDKEMEDTTMRAISKTLSLMCP